MKIKWFSFKTIFLLLVSGVFLVLSASQAQAYYYGAWNIDGVFKSQYGIFTEHKPFNKPAYTGSNDNTATAKQMLRWNLNGQLTSVLSLRAEVMGVWEPDYTAEKNVLTAETTRNPDGTYTTRTYKMPANYYNSFDWRELTLEYKPTYAHTIRFGRQIINWGEAISGRVIDQCNPVDSRTSGGILGLDETYMPLWMFRGIHDFSQINSSFEWIIAPVWQADKFEQSRGVLAAVRQGDGKTTNTFGFNGSSAWDGYSNRPWARWANNNEARVEKFYGADMVVNRLGAPASIYGGGPFGTGYHGSDLLPGWQLGDPIRALTYAETISGANGYPVYPPSYGAHYDFLTDANVIWTEIPSTDGVYDPLYGPDLPDHNIKDTRYGFKTKHLLWGAEGGFAFFHGPGSSMYHYKHLDDAAWRTAHGIPGTASGRLIFQRVVPFYNTFGIYGNYQVPFGVFVLESAYMPKRQFHKVLMGVGREGVGIATAANARAERLDNLAETDMITTLIGLTKEANIDFLNKYNVITIRAQYTATNYLGNMDDVSLTTYFMEYDQMEHNLSITASTAYAYNKYSPSLTIAADPRGAVLTSLSFGYVPEGFNTRLRLSASWTNYWANDPYCCTLALPDKNDNITVGVQYSFY